MLTWDVDDTWLGDGVVWRENIWDDWSRPWCECFVRNPFTVLIGGGSIHVDAMEDARVCMKGEVGDGW